MRLYGLLPAVAAALLPGAGLAQYQMVSPMLYNGPRISLEAHAQTRSSAPVRSSAPQPRRAVDAPARTQSPAGAGVRAGPMAFRYTPDLGRRRANLAQFVARTRATDPAGADQLAALFASGDILQKMQGLMAPYGLRIDDLADAYAIYWIVAWQATRGSNATPSRTRIAAVKAQAARALAGAGARIATGDAARQQLAEALWIQMAMIDAAVEQAQGKPDQLRAIGAAAAQGARGMGIDLAAMDFTDRGFVPR